MAQNGEKRKLGLIYGDRNAFVSTQKQVKKVRFMVDDQKQYSPEHAQIMKLRKSDDDDELSRILRSIKTDKESPLSWKKCWHTLKRVEHDRKLYTIKTRQYTPF